MDVRIGYPNEHLAAGNTEEITSPLFATGVGLVIKGYDNLDYDQYLQIQHLAHWLLYVLDLGINLLR